MPTKHPNLFLNDLKLHVEYRCIAGIDEAGRGPIAGPVVIGAVILDKDKPIEGLYDSKQLTALQREKLYDKIIQSALCYNIVEIDHLTIDKINILQASLLGMAQAAHGLSIIPEMCLIDGNKIPSRLKYPSMAIIRGDSIYACIAAASILAKVTRDRIMQDMELTYPGYGFAQHKGYPTPEHITALNKLGASPIHRLSYKPVSQLSIFDQM